MVICIAFYLVLNQPIVDECHPIDVASLKSLEEECRKLDTSIAEKDHWTCHSERSYRFVSGGLYWTSTRFHIRYWTTLDEQRELHLLRGK